VDYSSIPDHTVTPPYKYVLTVQDHLTKFVHLRPCQSKEGVEVAKHLYLIFCEFGAPLLLQSDNGLEFRNQVVAGLKILWPDLQIVHGRSRRPQTQGSVERANGDFQPMLGSWMRENQNPKWSLGLPLVMHQKNRKYHTGIKTTPFNAVFGKEAYNGLEITNLSAEIKKDVKTIKYLYRVLSSIIIIILFYFIYTTYI
jgi:hypothetical protein